MDDRVPLHKPWPFEKIDAKLCDVETKRDKVQTMLRALMGLVYTGKYGEGTNDAWAFKVKFILLSLSTT